MATFTEKQLFDRLWAAFTTDGSGNIALRFVAAGLAANSVNDTHIDWGFGANQVSAADIPIADAGTYFTTDNVEAALQQLALDMISAGAPENATYIVQTANATLTNEQVLSVLATGIVKNTTGTGVLSIAAAGTDYYAPGSTDVAVADGGTGSSTASDARTALGLAIGTDVQAYDADLAALAGLTSAANKLPYFTGAGTADVADFSAFARTLVDDADASAMRTTLGLAIGTNVQAYDADLATLAGLTATTDNFIIGVASAWASRTPAQAKTSLALVKADVGLGNVDNTSNATERAATATLTNKRIDPRVTSETSSATPTINTDNSDAHSITALATAVTSMTTNLSGTPVNFQKLIIRFKDNGTARAITWGASFEAKGVALPTTTVISKVLTVGFIYDTVSAKWGCIASAQEA